MITTPEILVAVALITTLLALSALFCASETSLTVASRARMDALEQEGRERARLVNQLRAAPDRIIGTALVGNNLVNVLASAIATVLFIRWFGDVGVIYATIMMTIIITVFAEVLPKTYAIAYPERIALIISPAMRVLVALLRPLTAGVQFIVACILKSTPGTRDERANILAPHDALRGAIELQTKEGAVAKGDANMLGGVLDLLDLQVLDIMVHRTKMQTLDADAGPEQILAEVLKSQYTRLPVWKDEPENIVGILHAKDLFTALSNLNWDPSRLDIKSLCKEPWFVPDTTGVKDQLNEFLKRRAHVALVVDEYGEVQGLIALEDILEEIVGQIIDEHDAQDTTIRPQADGTVNVDGSLPIRDLNRQMDWGLPDEDATTIAGLVIHEAQTIPEPGQIFTFHGYRFEILRKNRNRITALRVKPLGAGIAGKAPAANEIDPMISG